MAEGVSARLTAAGGRRFGLTVGGAFIAIAALLWWQGSPTGSAVLGFFGATLAVAGLAIPTRLGPIERAWMTLAHAISKVTTPIVMGVLYLGVLFPAGLLRRALGGNPLLHAEQDRSFWRPRPEGRRRSGSMQRQF